MQKGSSLKLTALVNTLSVLKIPLLAFCMPRVVESSALRNVIKIPIGWRTRNHLGSMYFGALAMGAELSIAMTVVRLMHEEKLQLSFIFKEFSCEFLKRAETDVEFVCLEAPQVEELVRKAMATGERLEGTFAGYARAYGSHRQETSGTKQDVEPQLDSSLPDGAKSTEEKLMTYRLTISLKAKKV